MSLAVPTKSVAARAVDLSISSAAGPIVSGVSFEVPLGATLGIVGESGSGKSLTARALSGLLPSGVVASGRVIIGERAIELPGTPTAWRELRGHGVTLILQDPFTSLSPSHRCGAQIAWGLRERTAAGGRGRRLARRDVREAVARLLEDVNLSERVASRYPGELSGGMRQRVAVAAALAAGPVLMVADEPTTALDASNQRDVLELLARLQREHGMGMVLISHDLGMVRDVADEVLVMYAGRAVEHGPTSAVLDKPAHPYTAALRDSELPLAERLERLIAIPGRVPAPGERLAGCAFAPRCRFALDSCSQADVTLAPLPDGRLVACLVSSGPLEAARPRVVEETTAPATDVVLRVENLVKSFPGVLALAGVSLEVPAGGSVGIVGESGSGKTTLARCVAGLDVPDSGRLVFRELELTSRTRTVSQVQMVFQDPYSALNPKIRVGPALAEAARAAGRRIEQRSPEELLELVGLPTDYARKYPRELSGGERQRVAIARSLAPGPELLVCDESVSALDVSVQAQVLNLLTDLRSQLGLCLLFISHDLAVVRQVSDSIHVIKAGRIVESGRTHEVLATPGHEYTRQLISALLPTVGVSVP